MKWRYVDKTKWNTWFAWRPVRVSDGFHSWHWAWMERLERKRAIGFEGISINANYVYREITKEVPCERYP